MSSGGQGRGEGRARQEGQAQEGEQGRIDQVGFDAEAIFRELSFGREYLFMKNDVCIVCGRTEEEHVNSSVVHSFTSAGQRVDTSQFNRRRPEQGRAGDDVTRRIPGSYGMSQGPFDPVLRQALIDKGILTPEDLAAAAAKISAITGQVMRGE